MGLNPITVSKLKAIVKDPHEHVLFRQTVNHDVRRWNCVQRQNKDKWYKIANQKLVTKDKGWTYALWRVNKIMRTRVDTDGRPHWKCTMHKIYHKPYTTYYLVCKRLNHSISGIY